MPDEKTSSRRKRALLESGEFIRADQVARKLGISRRKVYELLDAEKCPLQTRRNVDCLLHIAGQIPAEARQERRGSA
jgi:hypothetical protein